MCRIVAYKYHNRIGAWTNEQPQCCLGWREVWLKWCVRTFDSGGHFLSVECWMVFATDMLVHRRSFAAACCCLFRIGSTVSLFSDRHKIGFQHHTARCPLFTDSRHPPNGCYIAVTYTWFIRIPFIWFPRNRPQRPQHSGTSRSMVEDSTCHGRRPGLQVGPTDWADAEGVTNSQDTINPRMVIWWWLMMINKC